MVNISKFSSVVVRISFNSAVEDSSVVIGKVYGIVSVVVVRTSVVVSGGGLENSVVVKSG